MIGICSTGVTCDLHREDPGTTDRCPGRCDRCDDPYAFENDDGAFCAFHACVWFGARTKRRSVDLAVEILQERGNIERKRLRALALRFSVPHGFSGTGIAATVARSTGLTPSQVHALAICILAGGSKP